MNVAEPSVPDTDTERLERLLAYERSLYLRGLTRIAGVDEAGMGPLAGPVVAAAVVLPMDRGIMGADDSKKLTARRREALSAEIRGVAIAWSIGIASAREVDRWNIRVAGLVAMRRALLALDPVPEHVLVDARAVPDLPWPQEQRIQADAHWHAVACASILAKVHRDRLMRRLDARYPSYGFARHKGYGTPEHLTALREHGPCPAHRRTFQWRDSADAQHALAPRKESER